MWPTALVDNQPGTCPEYFLEQHKIGEECIPASNFLPKGFDQRFEFHFFVALLSNEVGFILVGRGWALT